MAKPATILFVLLAFLVVVHGITSSFKSIDASEEWGYVQVRPKAHMFWWLYKSPYRVEDPNKPWPVILWLQGGPGSSGTGKGNFLEVGPLDIDLKPRNSTWLKKADLLFVDNPVGTGFSFVEDDTLLLKTDEEAAADLTRLLIELYNQNVELQERPLYIVGESYGGKLAVTLGLAAHQAILDGKLIMKFGGVALGDSWISPEDYVLSWGPLLDDLSRLDYDVVQKVNGLAEKIKHQINDRQFTNASASDTMKKLDKLQTLISENTNYVDFYNFMLDSKMNPISSRHDYLKALMEGPIRKKLKIIPSNVEWSPVNWTVFKRFTSEFMKPRIAEVDELLSKGINVTVYNGQLDLICSTQGTQAWVENLKWHGLKSFLSGARTPLHCEEGMETKGFRKVYKNFHFYWILGAGHYVPVDQPCIALNMVGNITQSPAS